MAIRNVIGKYLPLPPDPIPANNTKKAYGPVQLSFVSRLQMKWPQSYTCFIFVKETIIVKLHSIAFTPL